MRTYKEPKRIDKPRGREPGIVNPDYVNRIAASYHQKNNLIHDGNCSKEHEAPGANHSENPKDTEKDKTIPVPKDTNKYPEEEDADNTGKDVGNGLAEETSPLPDNDNCQNDSVIGKEDSKVLCEQQSNCKNVCDNEMNSETEKTELLVGAQACSESTSTAKKKKVTKPKIKPKESNSSDTKNGKSKCASTRKKSSPVQCKSKIMTNSEMNGSGEQHDDSVIDPTPPKKKKSSEKSPPSCKSQKKVSKSKKKETNNTQKNEEDTSLVSENDDNSDVLSRSDASSPRVSKRTPKRNRKYHSEDEAELLTRDESGSSKKEDKGLSGKKSSVRKRKLLFEDDEIETEQPVQEEVTKPVKKKRKKQEEKSVKDEEDAELEPVKEKVSHARKKQPPKQSKKTLNKNVIPTEESDEKVTENTNTSEAEDILQEGKAGLENTEQNDIQNDMEQKTSSENKSKPEMETGSKANSKKKKKTVKKSKVVPPEEMKEQKDCSVNVDDGKNCDKQTEVKKKPRKKKVIEQSKEESEDRNKEELIKKEDEKTTDVVKEEKKESVEGSETVSPEDGKKAVKKEQVTITCQHCGHISHSKGANTRHLRKCVVTILKGDAPLSPTRAGPSTADPETEKKEGPSENGEVEVPEIKSALLLQSQEIKKIEKGTTGEAQYKCKHCTYATPKRAMLARHMRTHGIFVCLRCTFISDTHDSLKDHCHREHKDRTDFKLCRKCSRYVKCTDVSLEKHMEECQGPVPFICTYCSKEFKYESSLKSHIIRHNPDAPKRFHCEKCSYESNYKANLKKHMANIHGEKIKHVRCLQEDCEKMFFTEDSMKRHLKWHSEERPFKCPSCDKRFKTNTALRGHKVIHDPSRPFKCNINGCTKDFRSKKHLKNHQEEFHQTADKKFLCQYEACTFAFFKRSHLERHLITHTGERKYGCRVCGRAFRHADNLKIHMRQHTNEKPVKCDLCDFACRQKSSLQYHLRKFHNIIPPSKEASNHPVAIDGVKVGATEGNANSDSLDISSVSKEKKPCSPSNKSQNPMDLYEFKSDDEMDGDALLPLFQDKSLLHKSYRANHIDKDEKDENEAIAPVEVGDTATIQETNKEEEEQPKPPKEKKKVVRKKKKPKIDKLIEKEAEEGEESKDIDKDQKEKDDKVEKEGEEKEGESEGVKSKPIANSKGKGRKRATAKNTSPKIISPKEVSPKVTSPKSAAPKSTTIASKANASKGTKDKKTPPKKGKKGKVEVENEQTSKAENKTAPKRSPRLKAGGTKKSPGSKKKPKAKKKKVEPVVVEDLDETDEYREDDEDEKEKIDKLYMAPEQKSDNKEVDKDVEDDSVEEKVISERVEDLSDREESPKGVQVDGLETSEVADAATEKHDEDIDDTMLPSKTDEIGITETIAEVSTEVQSKVDEDSDRMSSGIDTDFEEELKPPPAPRPPPVVDSDEGDIESGPEDIDTPGRDFESTPPKSVANSENIHSVQSHSGGEPRLDSDFGDSMSQNYRRSESQQDSGSDVKRDHDQLDTLAVSMSKDEHSDMTGRHSPLNEPGPTTEVTGNNNGDYGGSQSESTMPDLDKEYLGQYLQQFDSTGRSEDEVSRLDRLDATSARPIDIPSTSQEKELPPLNLSATAPPLNLTTSEIQSESQPQGTDMSNKRMEILECDRQHENHYQPSRSVSPMRSSERIPDNVYDSLNAINTSYIPTPTARETPIIRQSENIFPPSTTTTTSSSSFMRFTENDALLQRQRMTTPFLTQSDPNALQNLHRMADSALASHSTSASSLLRRPTTVPPREDMFTGPTAVAAQTMARNPFNSWAGVAGQDVRPPHWSQTPYLQRDRPTNSASSPLFSKDNYLSGRDFMFDPSRRSVTERNMFPGLPQSTTRPELPHETFPLDRFEFSYFGSHGYPAAPSLDYTRSQCSTSQKSLEERYRQTATGMPDFRAFPQTTTSEMFSGINMNTSFNLDKYMYNREPIYHPQHMSDSTNSPYLPHGVAPQHSVFDRDYPHRGFYQNSPYSFVNPMNDKQYAAAAAASAKLTHPSGTGVTQERDFVPRPNTGAAAAPDNQIQDPYRNPLLFNMMNRYNFE